MAPRVTVIIPTYNWSTVLPYSIGSVLRQTMSDFELLVVGDGCTDDSQAVVERVGDPRVRWINLPANTGHQSDPNNEGLRQARGELIAYLGHDDLWLPHHLACAVEALDRGADLTHSLIALVRKDGDAPVPVVPRPASGSFSSPAGIVHRREVSEKLGGWREYRQLEIPPDVDMWRRAYAAGFRFEFVPRFTAIKFPALARRDVYKIRPCHEQAAWAARIESEPDFEAVELTRMLAVGTHASISYRELAAHFFEETLSRMRRRIAMRSRFIAIFWPRKGFGLDDIRRFKGL